MTSRVADAFSHCPELDDWDIYAVDGHYHKAACFDPKREASDGSIRATDTREASMQDGVPATSASPHVTNRKFRHNKLKLDT